MKVYLDIVWRQSTCYHEMRLTLLLQDRRSACSGRKGFFGKKKKKKSRESKNTLMPTYSG